MKFGIGIIDYKGHIARRYALLTGLGSLIDGLVILLSLGILGSSFSLKFVMYGSRKEMNKKCKNRGLL